MGRWAREREVLGVARVQMHVAVEGGAEAEEAAAEILPELRLDVRRDRPL